MSGTIAAGANKLSGLTTRLFGWSPDQFWNATPAELASILTTQETDQGLPLSRSELDSLLEREQDGH